MGRKVAFGTSTAAFGKSALAAVSDSDNDDDNERQLPIQLSKDIQVRSWINEDEWNITIEHDPDVDRLRPPSVVSIFRVPNFLKQPKKGESYVPKIISLGPYHHKSAHLPPMDNHKGRALRRMMARFNINQDRDLNDTDFSFKAKDEIFLQEEQIRNAYEEKIDCEADNLALMLSLDGCFILEILRTLGGESFPVAEASKCYDPIFERNKIDYTGFDILCDILMLENQVPLIVLRKLLKLELKQADDVEEKLLKVLVKSSRSKFYPFKYDMKEWAWSQLTDGKEDHLLGLLHALIVSPPCSDPDQIYSADREDQNAVRRIPRAGQLKNAGIKFEACNGGINRIKFDRKKATIYLPPINITDYTEVLFRNLIALEVCKPSVINLNVNGVKETKPSVINYVTCYLSLMDDLIDSEV
ncbi:hypothetical protein KI387_035333 [Taxus chinensis]|uniref:Uncharacterized protein n=1 Tax=Taxus chinensis TaxID=29808 RepID=A0AA38FNQ4_TAXCH|nr:hypothetical protein KI387_035333 [Taxus chinensis]